MVLIDDTEKIKGVLSKITDELTICAKNPKIIVTINHYPVTKHYTHLSLRNLIFCYQKLRLHP